MCLRGSPTLIGLLSIGGYIRDNGKANGNYYNGLYIRVTLGLYTKLHLCRLEQRSCKMTSKVAEETIQGRASEP